MISIVWHQIHEKRINRHKNHIFLLTVYVQLIKLDFLNKTRKSKTLPESFKRRAQYINLIVTTAWLLISNRLLHLTPRQRRNVLNQNNNTQAKIHTRRQEWTKEGHELHSWITYHLKMTQMTSYRSGRKPETETKMEATSTCGFETIFYQKSKTPIKDLDFELRNGKKWDILKYY